LWESSIIERGGERKRSTLGFADPRNTEEEESGSQEHSVAGKQPSRCVLPRRCEKGEERFSTSHGSNPAEKGRSEGSGVFLIDPHPGQEKVTHNPAIDTSNVQKEGKGKRTAGRPDVVQSRRKRKKRKWIKDNTLIRRQSGKKKGARPMSLSERRNVGKKKKERAAGLIRGFPKRKGRCAF